MFTKFQAVSHLADIRPTAVVSAVIAILNLTDVALTWRYIEQFMPDSLAEKK